MWLAGIPVTDPAVLDLIERLREAKLDATADHLQRTRDRGARIVGGMATARRVVAATRIPAGASPRRRSDFVDAV